MSDQLQFSLHGSRDARREAGPRTFRRKIDCTAPEARHDAKSPGGQAARGPVPSQDETTPPVAPRELEFIGSREAWERIPLFTFTYKGLDGETVARRLNERGIT